MFSRYFKSTSASIQVGSLAAFGKTHFGWKCDMHAICVHQYAGTYHQYAHHILVYASHAPLALPARKQFSRTLLVLFQAYFDGCDWRPPPLKKGAGGISTRPIVSVAYLSSAKSQKLYLWMMNRAAVRDETLRHQSHRRRTKRAYLSFDDWPPRRKESDALKDSAQNGRGSEGRADRRAPECECLHGGACTKALCPRWDDSSAESKEAATEETEA